MQLNNPLLDDLSKMAAGAAASLMDVKREVAAAVAAQADKFLDKHNYVSKEAFEAVQAMAAKAREENEELKKRVDALESRLQALASK